MSNKSAPKLKTDFMQLYKGMYQTGIKKTPTSLSKGALVSRQKTASIPKKPEIAKENKPAATKGQDPSKSINSLFRSTGKVEPHPPEPNPAASPPPPANKMKTSPDEKKEVSSNIIFNHRNITKGRFALLLSRSAVANGRVDFEGQFCELEE